MATASLSFRGNSKSSIGHNNRTIAVPHADKGRGSMNIFLIQEDIKDAYNRLFGDALSEFNKKQKRSDRKIKSYFSHVKNSKRSTTQQELIVQIGKMEDFQFQKNANGGYSVLNPDLYYSTKSCLTRYVNEFQERNPNLYVYNASIHMDEATPHLHLNFIPWHELNKNGLQRTVGFDKALLQQRDGRSLAIGNLNQVTKRNTEVISPKASADEQKQIKKENKLRVNNARRKYLKNVWDNWKNQEVDHLKELMISNDIEFIPMNNKEKHVDHIKYKEIISKATEVSKLQVNSLTKKISKLDTEIDDMTSFYKKKELKLDNSLQEKKTELSEIEYRVSSLKRSQGQIMAQIGEVRDVVHENIQLKRELNTVKHELTRLKLFFTWMKDKVYDFSDWLFNFNQDAKEVVVEDDFDLTDRQELLQQLNQTIDVSDMSIDDEYEMEM